MEMIQTSAVIKLTAPLKIFQFRVSAARLTAGHERSAEFYIFPHFTDIDGSEREIESIISILRDMGVACQFSEKTSSYKITVPDDFNRIEITPGFS